MPYPVEPVSLQVRTMPIESVAPHPLPRRRHSRSRDVGWALALVLLLPLAGHAQEWSYRVRPGDTLWDLTAIYLREGVGWQRLQAHNRVADPLRLLPGRTLNIPLVWLRQHAGSARLVALHGTAEISHSGTFADAQAATEAMSLAAGAAVRTGTAASLTLEFADGSRLNLRSDSEVHLSRLRVYGRTGMVDTRLRLVRGRASSQVVASRGSGSHYSVESPGMMSSVRGTQFRTIAEGGGSRSEVLQGEVKVSGGQHALVLAAGHGSQLDAAGHLLPAQELLPAPDISAWPRTVTHLPLTLAWPEVADAHGYRMEVSASPGFDTLLQDFTTSAAQAAVQVDYDGALYVRVRAITDNGLEGRDATAVITLATQPAPPFMLAPGAGTVVAGAHPRLRWAEATDPALRYRVQLTAVDDGVALLAPANSFAVPLAEADNLTRGTWRPVADLPPGEYAWRVAAVRADGHTGPWSDPMPFTLVPAGDGPPVTASVDGRTLKVYWQQGEPDQRYQFQLARTVDFSDPLRDATLDAASITLPGLRSGTWYMRMRILDDDGYAHPFGPAQQVRIGCRTCWMLPGAALLIWVL